MSETTALFWHRADLRTADNRGLSVASDAGPVTPVYVLDPSLLETAGPERTGFLLGSLAALQRSYRSRGSDLFVRRGDPSVVIPEIASEIGAEAVFWNEDYSRYAIRRDEAVRTALPNSVGGRSTPDRAVHQPGSILTTAGEHYSVFSYYDRKWQDRDVQDPYPKPDSEDLSDCSGPDVVDVLEPPSTSLPLPPGRSAALERLDSFLEGPIESYAELRDRPAAEGTSRLSQDLSLGLLGAREVLAGIDRAASRAETESAAESIEEFRRQIAWRDFYLQVLAATPESVTENFQEFPNQIEWREDPDGLRAWKAGETGYPIVDAGMRQLQEEAYMHNRVRMIVASFLTKDLQIDWREGYRHFRTHLLDHDTANDVGGWQWAASTGTDAQPYFRVFNPMTQGERYDPDATYIKRYVPELADVDPERIHSWTDLDPGERNGIAPDYPAPIVDHGQRRESAIAMFERAKGTE